MTQIPADNNQSPTGTTLGFANHLASTAWERVVIDHSSGMAVWAWYRPPHLSDGVVFKLTAEIWQTNFAAPPLTLRRLLSSIEVEPASVAAWSLYGAPFQAMLGNAPFLDQPVPPPMPGVEPDIAVCIGLPAILPGENHSPSIVAESAVPTNVARVFDSIESDWKATDHLERQMDGARKQLTTMTNRLNTLNRDLTPEENAVADRLDKSDWQDARRWLRDAVSQLSRCIKQHDVGETSMAGNRDSFQRIYEQSVRPRRPFEGMQQAQREFEMYRKRCQTQLAAMLSALGDASQEGERRATGVLARLATKVRDARVKRVRGK